ncbi:hypothetical protein N7516_004573 [Penicillium verrucosum]|uniref:uncharacterized protein n=1 Tax=Penicillium verrucosum TaxID=60171 RepID=UPI002545746D|nr:uncharacterized protein N7516_004573 [Penicillium verrucosum]KAJ5944405.1 hypothetical protein N7516_004573 [Penicillium verrucosum]
MAVFKYGDIAGLAIYILWWVNTGTDIITCMVSPFMCHKMQQSGTQAYMLMPFLVVLTSNAGSGVICQPARIGPLLQVSAIIISHLKIGAGLNLVNSFIADMVYHDMIMYGPYGQASVALQALGEAVMAGSFAGYDRGQLLTAKAAGPFAFIGHFIGLLVCVFHCPFVDARTRMGHHTTPDHEGHRDRASLGAGSRMEKTI